MLYSRRGDFMPRQKSGNFDPKQYVNDYIKTKIVYRRMNFNNGKPEDMQMVEWIDAQPEGVSNYLKRLVLDDMSKARQ